MDKINQSKNLIGNAANEQRTDRFSAFFVPYMETILKMVHFSILLIEELVQ